MATGIPPSVWADEGGRAVTTAIDVINRKNRRGQGSGRQMNG